MREQLEQYVNLLFADRADAEEIRDEILQNTLDRFDDLVAQGRSPEVAYGMAIAGIGDLDEILGTKEAADYAAPPVFEDAGIPVSRVIRAFAVGLYIISLAPIILMDTLGLSNLGVIGTLVIIAAATALMILFPKRGSAEEPALPTPSAGAVRTIRAAAIGLYVVSLAPLLLLDSFGLSDLGVACTLAIVAAATVLVMIYRKPKQAVPVQEPVRTREPKRQLKKSVSDLIGQLGVAAYFVVSFATGAWGITWVIFLLIPAVKGLAEAILDLRGE